MLALTVIGQPPSMSKQNKSIKVFLDIVLSSTFVCLQLKDFDSGNIFLRERLDYKKISDPTTLLTKIEEILKEAIFKTQTPPRNTFGLVGHCSGTVTTCRDYMIRCAFDSPTLVDDSTYPERYSMMSQTHSKVL